MAADRPFLGVLLVIGFCVFAPMGDAIAKFIGGRVPLFEVLFVRFAVQVVILLAIMGAWRRRFSMSRGYWGLSALRAVLHLVGVGAFFWSLRYLPLADSVAIVFVMPFLLIVLSRVLFGEVAGPRRYAACVVGFAGTLLIVQPSFGAVGSAALWPFVVALAFTGFVLVTRAMAKAVDPIELQAASGIVAVVLLAPLLILSLGSTGPAVGFVVPDVLDGMLMAAIGVIGTLAHLFMTWSLKHASAATLAPVHYLEIPFAALIGWLVFGDFPNGLALGGIALSIAAGLYIVYRERPRPVELPPDV
jgi:drug/metabolite transporter (DMT)-like permease